MDLLGDGIAQGFVRKTDQNRKLTIDGRTDVYPVYAIKLDKLRFNYQNDRIASWTSSYRADHGTDLDPTDPDYNGVIEGYVVASNPDAIRKTQNNIKLNGQQEPGVVLDNGIVIDGNRRFTCLRRLAADDPSFSWFEAIILDSKIAADPKRIKMLELSIQHGREARVPYDPIDRLVGVYLDLIKNQLLTLDEYAKSCNLKQSEVKQYMVQAGYLVEFLEFIGAPEQFHIARELSLSGPIGEIDNILKKCKNEDEQERVKALIYANMLVEPQGDITRFVRQFKNVLTSKYADEFLDEEEEVAEKIVDAINDGDEMTAERIRKVRATPEFSEGLKRPMDKANEKLKREKVFSSSTIKISNALSDLEDADPDILKKLSEEFDMESTHILMCKADMDRREVKKMAAEMEDTDGVQFVLGFDTLVGSAIPEEIIPDSVKDVLKGDEWQLMLIGSDYQVATDEVNTQVGALTDIAEKYDSNAMLIGEAPATKDLIDITNKDFKVVNILSIAAIFLIILITFKSISLPIILVSVIELAIVINLGASFFTHTTLPFIASIVVGTIQLGATVDYAILMTTRYKTERSSGKSKKESIGISLRTSIRSIVTSAFGFFAATVGVAVYSKIGMISSLCMLLSRGALISMVVVVTVLPSMFMIFDKVICKTSAGFLPKNNSAAGTQKADTTDVNFHMA